MDGRTYITVDMDFWNNHLKAEKKIVPFIKKAKEKNIPILSVMNHHQILSRLPFADNLINIDYHSDLADRDVDILNCGTWVSHVQWRRRCSYIWIRNEKNFFGSCQNLIWTDGSPVRWNYNTDWNRAYTLYRPGIKIESLIDDSCIGICISLSPSFVNESIERKFYELRNEFRIPYIKGRRNEFFDIKRKPKLEKHEQINI